MSKEPKTGNLYVFEGPDGVGKTTIAHTFAEYLNRLGTACDYLSFPGHVPGTLGEHVYRLYHRPMDFGIRAISPIGLQVMVTAAHIDVVEQDIKPALRCGRSVILDRFWWSTWVYGLAAGVGQSSVEELIQLERIQWNGIEPIRIFLILRSRPLKLELDVAGWQDLALGYKSLAERERDCQVCVIYNEGSIDDASRKVIEQI